MRRLGKFYITSSIIDSLDAVDLFKKMEFVPFRVEYIFHRDTFEYIGTSPLFELCSDYQHIPEYLIEVTRDADGKELQFQVSLVKQKVIYEKVTI